MHLPAGSSIRLSAVTVLLVVNFCFTVAQAIPNPFLEDDISILPSLLNGVRLIVKEDHSQPTVAIEVVVKCGSAEDEGTSGIAHLLEHVCFQGSANYPEPLSAQYALETAGIMSNAFTNRDMTRFQVQTASGKVDFALNTLADIVLRPTLSDDSCEKQKALVEEEIAHIYDNPVGKLIDGAYAASYPSFPYKNPALGAPADLGKITGEKLRQFHQRWYVPGNISVVIAGDITKERAAELVRKAFGNVKAKKPPSLPIFFDKETVEPTYQHIKRNLPDTWQVMAFSIPSSNDIYSLASLQLVKTLLTDGPNALSAQWVMDGIDAKKYGVELLPSRFPGLLLIWAETSPEMADRLRLSTLKVFSQLATTPIEATALKTLKLRQLSKYFLENDTVAQQAGTLAAYEGLDQVKNASNLVTILNNLTANDICTAMTVRYLAWVTLGQPPRGFN